MIPHSRPTVTSTDVENVEFLLHTGMLAQGALVQRLQSDLAKYLDVSSVALASSGAMAIRGSLQALGIGSRSRVALPTYVCGSVLWAVQSTGAEPILLDSSGPWISTSNDLDRALALRADVYVRVHTFGIDGSTDGASGAGILTLDDKAQALPLSVALPGVAATYSFSATKYMTTGEGGAVASDDSDFLERFNSLQGPGMRFSDLAAQLGLTQLGSLPAFIERRLLIARRYLNELPEELTVHTHEIDGRTCYFRFPVTVSDPESVMRVFAANGIVVRRGVDSLLHRSLGVSDDQFPKATRLFRSTVSLPIYPALTDAEQSMIIETAWRATNG